MIDDYNNQEKKVEIRILQGSPVSLILLFIYISRVFE